MSNGVDIESQIYGECTTSGKEALTKLARRLKELLLMKFDNLSKEEITESDIAILKDFLIEEQRRIKIRRERMSEEEESLNNLHILLAEMTMHLTKGRPHIF